MVDVNRLKKLLDSGVFAVVGATCNSPIFEKRGNLFYLNKRLLIREIANRKISTESSVVNFVKRIMDSNSLQYYDFHIEWLKNEAKTLLNKSKNLIHLKNTVILRDSGYDVEVIFGRRLTPEELSILKSSFSTRYYIQDGVGNLTERKLRVFRYDKERRCFRIPYFGVQKLIKISTEVFGFRRVIDNVQWVNRKISPPSKLALKLYKFQSLALNKWARSNFSGVIVVPTGGGKTYIGMFAIACLCVPTLICVTTIELARQWIQKLNEHLGIKACLLGGGKHEIGDVTVAIYNSAAKHIDKLADKFDLAIFDECLTYDTLILTDRGWIPIGEIVENKLPVRVLTHRGRFMPIVGWHKIPLRKRLVKVVLEDGTEIKCTEDHKFLTERGWVEATKLLSGDVLYKVNDEMVSFEKGKTVSEMRKESCECEKAFGKGSRNSFKAESVPLLSENVQGQECSWRAYPCSSSGQGAKCSNSKGKALEKDRSREVERSPQESHGEERSLEKEYRPDRISEEFDSWNYVRRRSHAVSEQKEQEREAYDKTFFKAIRVCYVEILSPEESRENETENRREQGIWEEGGSVQHNVPSVLNGALQFSIYQREADCERELVGEHYTPNSSCCLVFGQRHYNEWDNENKSMEDATRGSGNFAGVVEEEVGHNGKHIQYEKRDCIRNTEEKRHKEVHVFDRALCDSRDEIQDYVYDLTVAEDHSYVANGVIVHNCHHVPADSFRKIAFFLKARKRLGLSATPKRIDRNESLIFFSVGRVVYQAKYTDMVKLNLASPIQYRRFYVELTPEEYEQYSQFSNLPSTNPSKITKMMKVAFIAEKKYEILKKLIQKLPEDKILVFCQYVDQAKKAYKAVREIVDGQAALLTGSTKSELRKRYFEQFKDGKKRIIVTTTVLDEGIDVPDAETAIILSGSGTERQMIQRIGRVLRYRPNKVAKVIEIITKNTIEERIAERRAEVLREYGLTLG